MPKEIEGQPLLVTGLIASLPVTDKWHTHFFFSLEKWQHDHIVHEGKTLIRLSWRDNNQVIKVGDRRQFLVKLKRIHGMQNPGSFDFEAWSLQKGLRATGYVIANNQNQLLDHHWYHYPIDQFRQNLQAKIKKYLPISNTAPWLMALMIGERNDIAEKDWEILRKTGTNHLMAIAGLHIGIMTGIIHLLVSWLWRRIPKLLLLFPTQIACAFAALIMGLFYSALAGFSIPTQRATIMLSVFIFSTLMQRQIHIWHVWSCALLIVLLLNPLSVLTESFWLSFGTIALIIYGMHGRLAPSGYWWKWGRVQWVIGIGLIPLTLFLFQQCSLISFFANTLAIPWLGFLILPFCFLSIIFVFIAPTFASLCLSLADKNMAILWKILTWFSQLNFATWHQIIPNNWILLSTIFGFILLLLPSGFPGRWLTFIWMLPLIFYQPNLPELGEIWLTLLDVGQGLAVVVQTKNHLLIYDTGPKYGTDKDTGESILLPYLRSIGAKKIDRLIISHGDNDHAGGAESLFNALPISMIETSVPDKFVAIFSSQYCIADESWQWDKVSFKFIYPHKDQLHFGNDSSCVLRIDNGVQTILLTGDIEKYAETNLLSKPQNLASFLLIAPHHGSKTSGEKEFISAVHPRYVLYATGYRNRYHFPHKSVIAEYEKMHAIQLNTAETGAIKFKLGKDASQIKPDLYRWIHKRYWYAD